MPFGESQKCSTAYGTVFTQSCSSVKSIKLLKAESTSDLFVRLLTERAKTLVVTGHKF